MRETRLARGALDAIAAAKKERAVGATDGAFRNRRPGWRAQRLRL
jgi:hypothetical protein